MNLINQDNLDHAPNVQNRKYYEKKYKLIQSFKRIPTLRKCLKGKRCYFIMSKSFSVKILIYKKTLFNNAKFRKFRKSLKYIYPNVDHYTELDIPY